MGFSAVLRGVKSKFFHQRGVNLPKIPLGGVKLGGGYDLPEGGVN